jgi:hypothetical protein
VKEEFIVYLWKNRLLQPDLYTTTGEAVSILHPGVENHDAGPDFMVARVRIGQTLWAGNVEIHVRASDWLKHRHEQDAAYDNIILHVVFICDKDIADKMGEHIPVLEVKDFFDRDLYEKYLQLKRSEKNIPCEAHIAGTDRFLLSHWLNRLLIERLEQKNREIIAYLDYFNNNREQVLYYFLARNFGFGINSMAFGLLAQRTPLPLLKKKRDQLFILEAILFGQAGILDDSLKGQYPQALGAEYRLYQKLHALQPVDRSVWRFARMRPQGFPAIRIAQFAMLLHSRENLFAQIISGDDISYHREFRLGTSSYWETHYHFDAQTAKKPKILGSQAIENILINTIAPWLFVRAIEQKDQQQVENALSKFFTIPAENNRLIRLWEKCGIEPKHAGESQALLQLRKYYCMPKRCLQCAIGHQLLRTRDS